MRYTKNENMLIKTLLSIVAILFSCSVYAEDEEVVYLDQKAIDRMSISCAEKDCYFPEKKIIDKDVFVIGQLTWDSDKSKNLIVHTRRHIAFGKKAKLIGQGDGSIILKAGMEPGEKGPYHGGDVIFGEDHAQIEMQGEGKVKIYYNPIKGNMEHKYHNQRYWHYAKHVDVKRGSYNFSLYMLVNNVRDLQDITASLSANYALSQNIDAAETKNWNEGRGFDPLKINRKDKHMPFSGNFDGNNYVITGLFINHPEENEIGLFGRNRGRENLYNTIENLTLENFEITGDHYVGSLAGSSIHSNLSNIKIINPKINSINVAGGLVGTIVSVIAEAIQILGNRTDIVAEDSIGRGIAIGGATETKIVLLFETERGLVDVLKKYKLLGVGNKDDQTEISLKTHDGNIDVYLKPQDSGVVINFKYANEEGKIISRDEGRHIELKNREVSVEFAKLFYTLLINLDLDYVCDEQAEGKNK